MDKEVIKLKTVEDFIAFYRSIDVSLYEGYEIAISRDTFSPHMRIYYDNKLYDYSITIAQEAKKHMTFEDAEKSRVLEKLNKRIFTIPPGSDYLSS